MTTVPPQCEMFGHRRLSSVWSNLSDDILRYLNKSPENQAAGDNFKHRLGAVLTPQLLCLVVYRMAHCFHAKRWRRLAVLLSRFNLVAHKVNIPPQSCIGPGCLLPHPAGVTFFGTAGCGLTIYSLAVCCPAEPFVDWAAEKAPRLGDRVTLGAHSTVVGPIIVGDDCKIAYSVRLERNAPPAMLVVSKALHATREPLLTGCTAASA